MLPDYAIQRTYAVKCGSDFGTAFTIDRNGQRYLLSAKHVFSSYAKNHSLECLTSSGWSKIGHRHVFEENSESHWDDFIVFSIGDQLQNASNSVIATPEDNYISQEILAFGFPVHFPSPLSVENSGFLPPMIKRGILSSVVSADGFGYGFMLDMFLNLGMSGGPIFARARDDHNRLLLTGMAVGFYSPSISILAEGREIATHNPNTGIALCIPINRIFQMAQI